MVRRRRGNRRTSVIEDLLDLPWTGCQNFCVLGKNRFFHGDGFGAEGPFRTLAQDTGGKSAGHFSHETLQSFRR